MAENDYEKKKRYFDDLVTLFGRNPVIEALRSGDIEPVRLHLAESNRNSPEIDEMKRLASERKVEIRMHTRDSLSRISKNGRQDQGVALDVRASTYRRIDMLATDTSDNIQLIALDQITNPQNLGMIVRSVGASPMAGLILAKKGTAPIDGLVIKASAGNLFKAHIYHCDLLTDALTRLREMGFTILGLDGSGDLLLQDIPATGKFVFVLGNETHGLSSNIRDLCDDLVRIPLANEVESLNVGAAASIVSFRTLFNQ